ncbi:MAG: putative toxin [Anaerolineae bacterium]
MPRSAAARCARALFLLFVLLVTLLASRAFVSAQTVSPQAATLATAMPPTGVAPTASPALPLPTSIATVLPAYPIGAPTVLAPSYPTATSVVPPTVAVVETLPVVPTPLVPTPIPTLAPTAIITTPVSLGPGFYPADEIALLPRLTPAHGRHQPGLGGSVASGAVRLTLPPQANGRALGLTLRTADRYHVLPPGVDPHLLFTIDLTDETDGRPVHGLAQAGELRINLRPLVRADRTALDVGLYHYDEAALRWQRVPATRDGNDLVAGVDQFSAYALATSYGQPWLPTARMDAADTDLFSGAAMFSIPLDTPQGTNGLAPKLSLAYSSAIADQMNDTLAREDNPVDNNSTGTEADWVGLGWSLGGVGQITQGVKETTINGTAARLREYHLELNGAQEKLARVDGAADDWVIKDNDIEYRTERDSFIKIIRRGGGPTATKPVEGASLGYGVYFEVWDKAGTYYRFGYTADAEHIRGFVGGNRAYDSAWGLGLDRVVDTHGNEMTVEYYEDKSGVTGNERAADIAAYPARIRYYAGSSPSSIYREIRFNEKRWVGGNPTIWQGQWNGDPNAHNRQEWRYPQVPAGYCESHHCYVQRDKLDAITLYIALGGGTLEPFRKVTFTYRDDRVPTWQAYQRRDDSNHLIDREAKPKLLLTGISEWAKGASPGADNDYLTTPLYGGTASYAFDYDTPGQTTLGHLQLTRIQSALGGTVSYTYATYRADLQGNLLAQIDRNHVSQKTLDAGLAPDPAMTWSYTYGQARYHVNPDDKHDEHLLGHEWAAVTDAAGTTVTHGFFTNQTALLPTYPYSLGAMTGADIDPFLRGREYLSETSIAGSGGNGVKGRVVTQYWTPWTITSGKARHVRVTRTATSRDPAGFVTGQVDIKAYQYDDYGNTTIEAECPDKSGPSDACEGSNAWQRRTVRWYDYLNAPGPGQPGVTRDSYRYIVDRPVVEGVDGDGSSGTWWPKVTYYSYDGSAVIPWDTPNQRVRPGAGPTTKGELTWVRRVDCWQCAGETTADTQYGYDSYGNRTTETTWDAFSVNGTTQGAARTVTTSYDATLHTFVTQVTQPNGLTETANWDTTAYRRQAPNWIDDANGSSARVSYNYDDFGRLLDITRPYDAGATEHYDYVYSAGAIPRLVIRATKRLDANRTMVSRTFYDGLGRVVLSKAPDPNGSAVAAVVATYYGPTGFGTDARGLKTAETLPSSGGQDDGYTRPTLTADFTTPRLVYAYDWAGALTLTTRADGTISLVTPIREGRVTSVAERGPEFGLPAAFNQSFETAGSGTCAQGWTCAAGMAERVGTGVDGRYALRVTGTTASAAASYGAGTIPSGATLSLSWLARRTSSTSGALTTGVTVNGVAVTVNGSAATTSVTATTQGQWAVYHWTFQAPTTSGNQQLAVSFQTPSGVAYEVDNVRLTWGEVRERVETADGLGRTAAVAERKDTTTWLTTQYAYDPLDRVTRVTDPNGNQTTSSRLDTTSKTRLDHLAVTDPDRGTWKYQYDPQGNVKLQTDGRLQQVSYSYDSLDRLVGKTYPGDASTPSATYSYDDATVGAFRKGRRTQMSVGGDTVTYTYDARGRVTQETRAIAGVSYGTGYVYNSADKVISQTYPDGETVTTTYNNAGRLNSVGGASAYLTSQTYDIAGKPLVTTLGNGAHSDSGYDAATQRLSQLQTWVKSAGNVTLDSDLRYGYDPFGNVTALNEYKDRTQDQGFGYDSLNRLTTVSGPFAQAFAYDNLGNLTQRDGQTYRYAAGKPHAVNQLGPEVEPRFGYDAAGNMTERGCYQLPVPPFPRTCQQTLNYDAEGRLTSVSGTSGTETYAYDGDGAIRRRASTPVAASRQFSDTFNVASLNSAWWQRGTGEYHTQQSGGTGHNHILTLQAIPPATPEVYRTNTVSNGQVVSMTFGVGTTTSNASFGLETGDWISGTYHRFGVWQKDGQLLLHLFRNSTEVQRAVLMPTLAANTWYVLELAVDDAAGFRATVWAESAPSVRYEMRWEMPTGQQTWRFHAWGSASTVTSLDNYQEGRPSVKTADVRYGGQHYEDDRGPTPSVTKRYYAEGRLLATRTGSTLTYVQSDHLGSTSTLTDASGNVVARERYSAFGERRRSDNLAITDQLYTGQQYNSLSGLYHYSDGKSAGRFYDPLLARFVMADSVTPGNASQGLNRYAYANNSPVRYNDPDGHCPMCVTAAVGAAIGAGVAYAPQVVANISRDGVSGNAFTNVNWASVGAGAVAGAVGAATFGVGTAIMGTGMVAEVGVSALSNVVAGQVAIATENVLSGQEVTEGLGNGSQILGDAVLGSAGQLARPGASMVLGAKAGDTALARSLGEAGEAAAGISGIKNRIPSLSRTARYRVPDEIINAEKLIREVKNVSELSYTKQLRDYVLWAKQKGYTFELLVRENGGTSLSQPLIDARNNGDLIIREVLP